MVVLREPFAAQHLADGIGHRPLAAGQLFDQSPAVIDPRRLVDRILTGDGRTAIVILVEALFCFGVHRRILIVHISSPYYIYVIGSGEIPLARPGRISPDPVAVKGIRHSSKNRAAGPGFRRSPCSRTRIAA